MKITIMKQIASFKNMSYVFLRKIDVDRAVLLGILAMSWRIIAGVGTLLFIAYKFSPQLQGYYYTFSSIIGFQFLLELGLKDIIIQFVSHEWSELSLNENGQVTGKKEALSRLQSMAQIFFRWYCVVSIVLTMGLGICGFFIFSKEQGVNINWMLPWFCLCICNGAIFCLVPIWSLLEGCNQIIKLYSFRLVQAIFLSVALWIAILLNAKLWALVISSAVIFICAGIFLLYKCRVFLKTILFSSPASHRVNWRKEILPLQWRTSVTWLIGSFAFNLFVPVLFKYHGSVVAGQMGMTLYLISIVSTMPSSWLSPKIPQFGMLIARKKYKDLDKLFWRTSKVFSVIVIVGAVMVWLIIYILNAIKHPIAVRFLPLFPTEIFILAQIILIISVPFSTYIRAHKKEPFLFVSVASGIFIGLATLILGKYYSAAGMALGYLSVNLILIPIVFVIWYRCRTEWHKDEYVDAIILDNSSTVNEVI